MSWQDSKWAVTQRAGSAVNKAVLMVLAEASRDGVSTLSQATLAMRTEASPRAVFSALRSLEADGLIDRRRRFNGAGHRTSDRITLKVSQIAPDATRANDNEAVPLAPDAVREGKPTRSSCRPYSQLVQPLLAPGATEPVLEPVDEPGVPLSPPAVSAFDQWWAVYPNRVKRKAAETAFAKVLQDGEASLAELVSAAAAYAESDKVRRGFPMNPTTWLNSGCWSDEPAAPPSTGHSGLDYALRSLG